MMPELLEGFSVARAVDAHWGFMPPSDDGGQQCVFGVHWVCQQWPRSTDLLPAVVPRRS